MTGLRFLFRVTLRRLDLAAEIYHLREPQKIPQVISPDEARRLLAVAGSLKARVLLSLSYGCGLRAGEVVRLKVKHIDSAQKIIRVEQSKGRKDRNVMLSPETLDLLRQWWRDRPTRGDAGTPPRAGRGDGLPSEASPRDRRRRLAARRRHRRRPPAGSPPRSGRRPPRTGMPRTPGRAGGRGARASGRLPIARGTPRSPKGGGANRGALPTGSPATGRRTGPSEMSLRIRMHMPDYTRFCRLCLTRHEGRLHWRTRRGSRRNSSTRRGGEERWRWWNAWRRSIRTW